MRTLGRLTLLASFLFLLHPRAAFGQDNDFIHPTDRVDALKTQSTESLLARYEYLKRTLEANVDSAPYGIERLKGGYAERAWQGYLDNLRTILQSIREVLGERGTRPPATVVGSGAASGGGAGGASGGGATTTQPVGIPGPKGSNTTQVETPGGGGPEPKTPSIALPFAIFLTAGEMARCATDGTSVTDCAQNFALKAAIGIPVGAAIAVLSPTGAIILTGWAVAETAGTLVFAATQASANYDQMSQQRANAARVTATQMNAIVDAYVERLQEAHVDYTAGDMLTGAMADLDTVVARASGEFTAFGASNAITKIGSAACATTQKQPMAYAAQADQRVKEMQRQADAVVKAVSDAAAAVASCHGADEARQAKAAYLKAQQDLQSVQSLGSGARADIQSAMSALADIKAARGSMLDAARHLAALARAIDDARAARTRLKETIANYRTDLRNHARAVEGVYVAVANLRGAFPEELPAHIASGFKRIDDAFTDEASAVFTDDRLIAIDNAAADGVSRVEGWHRLANEQFDDLRDCGQVTGEIPDAVRKDLARMGDDITAASARADGAVSGGKDIPAKADACAARSAAPTPDGRLRGDCTGTIKAVPERATPGSLLVIDIAIDPPFDTVIVRVATDNPACRNDAACDAQRSTGGRFLARLRYQAPAGAPKGAGVLGTFTVKFAAYDKDNNVRCTGQTKELTVLARQPSGGR